MINLLSAVWAKLLWLLSADTLLSIIGVGFALGLVILVHELGHFLACRLLDMRVEEFSIGFGKLLKKWKRGETQYSLRAIPLGGYVKPSGEFYAREADISNPRDFAAKPWYSRALMVFAGAGMNYVLAFIIFFIVVLSMGLPVTNPTKIPSVVGEVISDYPASGVLQTDDVITAIDGNAVSNWQEMVTSLDAAAQNGKAEINYVRDGQNGVSSIFFAKDNKIGISVKPVYERTGVFEALWVAGHQCYYWTALSLTTIADKLWHKQAPDVAGPIGIFEIVGKGVHSGVENYFFLIGLISVAIGMFNLFPIPILDGGHILFFIIEGIRGKRVKEKTLMRASSVGASLLILLVLYATYNDIARIGKRFTKQTQTQTVAAEQAAPAAQSQEQSADAGGAQAEGLARAEQEVKE